MNNLTKKLNMPEYAQSILENSKGVIFPKTRSELISLALGGDDTNNFEVKYNVDKGKKLCYT